MGAGLLESFLKENDINLSVGGGKRIRKQSLILIPGPFTPPQVKMNKTTVLASVDRKHQ